MNRQLLVTLLIIFAASIAEAQQSARTAIEANAKQFTEAFNKGDAAAVATMYTMDARVLPPNGEMVEGRPNIQKFWQGAISAGVKMGSLETRARRDTGQRCGGNWALHLNNTRCKWHYNDRQR